MARIGIIQPARLGDVLICLPIARWYAREGNEVYWPLDTGLLPHFEASAPAENIHYLPVKGPPDRWQVNATEALEEYNCDRVIDLSFGLDGNLDSHAYRKFLAAGLHFDAYKYQLAGVPLEEKWNFPLRRNPEAEARVLTKLNPARPYIVQHLQGSSFHVTADLPSSWRRSYDIIEIKPGLCENPFHLLSFLEQADRLIMVDSVFANLVDQAGFPQPKTFIERVHSSALSPTLRGDWQRVKPTEPTRLRRLARLLTRPFSSEPVFWGFQIPL